MELVLNLCWLMLVLPAYWLWRRGAECRHLGRRRSFLVLGSLLILLFPIISATDDLHFIRPDTEESGPSKRTLKHASNDKATSWASAMPTLLQRTGGALTAPTGHTFSQAFIAVAVPHGGVFGDVGPVRAPPSSLLA